MRKLIKGRALYTETERIWIAQGMTFFAVDYNGKRVTDKFSIGTLTEKLIGSNRLSRQLLRQGIHHLLSLPNGNVFLTSKKKSYVVDNIGKVKYTFTGYRGNKPGHQGVCVTPNGFIFFGEYTLNPKRDHDTRLFRSIDSGKTFQTILTLRKEEVRHIHFIKWDPYEECLWLGTGDRDEENFLMKSYDYGETWEKIGGGTQDWRAIGVCFNKDSIIWGTDAGSVPDKNHLIRMNRETHECEILEVLEGPCHGCASLKNSRVFVSTGVEGGENEKDRYARLKEVNGRNTAELTKKAKDYWPFFLQFGVIRFPLGTENTDKLVFTMFGLKGNGERVYIES